jgi:hypothetical protein
MNLELPSFAPTLNQIHNRVRRLQKADPLQVLDHRSFRETVASPQPGHITLEIVSPRHSTAHAPSMHELIE